MRDLVSTRTLSGKLTQWSSKNASASEVGRRVNFSGRIRLWSPDFNVVDCEVKLTSERREEAPRLFTHINLHFIVTGRDLKDAAVARAVDLSAEKYCSVALMLEKAVNITHSYEVVAA